jgi:hypothetical protein
MYFVPLFNHGSSGTIRNRSREQAWPATSRTSSRACRPNAAEKSKGAPLSLFVSAASADGIDAHRAVNRAVILGIGRFAELRRVPGFHHRHMRFVIVTSITSNDRETGMNCRCGDHQVRLRKGVTGLPAFLDEKPPLQHDVFRYFENAAFKHGAHLVRQPLIQFGSAIGFCNQFDAEAYLGKRHNADKNLIEWGPPQRQRPLVLAVDVAIPTGRLYRATTPLERNVTHRHRAA